MKKRIYSIFLMMLAVFCFNVQTVSAIENGSAPTKKTAEMEIFLEESFVNGLGTFVVEGPNGPEGDPIWKWDEWGTQDCVNASMWSGTDKEIDSYLVSPVFKIGRDNIANFSHGVAFSIKDSYSTYFGFCIREEGSTTWEELKINKFPSSDAKISSEDIIIPDSYNGKKVQVAFRYHATPALQLSWYIKNLVVKGFPVSDSGKEYAGIEFSAERVSYLFGGSDPFVAPEFKNPNNLEVTFSSSNTDVATVDAKTGIVTIKALGKTIIKAESKETDKFDAGLAQYTLNVVETLEKLESGLEWDIKELNTTFPQVPGFVQPVLLNPNKRPVTLTTSNDKVAIVDASTGVIHIQGLGIATITATSPENDEYKAGKATTTLVVTDATKVFTASFSQDICNFTEEGTKGIWKWNDGSIKAAGKDLVTTDSECYLVSPEMELGADGNFLKFEHICKNFTNPEEQALVVLREVGTDTWTPAGAMWYTKEGAKGFISSGLVRIPNSLNGKKVQLAFKYITDGNANAGEWTIRNLVVTKNIIKKDPEISYDITEVSYAIGEGDFKAPVLNNPYNLPIEYMSNNVNVANVDRSTGAVYVCGSGTCTITARCNETAEYKQGIAQYELTVTDPYLIFRDTFSEVLEGLGNFTEEGVAGCWGVSWGLATTSPWNTVMNPGDVSILVTPKMKLGFGKNTLTFDQKFMYVNNTPEKYAELVIRTAGGEWEKVEISYPDNEETAHSGNIVLPTEYSGKEVQLGFKYTCNEKVNGYEGTWTVNSIIIRKDATEGPKEKADPEIAFAQESIEINHLELSDVTYESPELINPHNVPVKYSSDNTDVVKVTELTGNFGVVGEGTATITATSEETEEYKSATASYKVTVVITPSGIECITIEDINSGKVYDLQGRKVNKLGKGIFIVNGKKVIVK